MGDSTMKLLTFFLLFSFSALGAKAVANSPIVGHWFYYKKIFRQIEMPEPPGATLRLHFEFHEDGTSRLYWWREGESDWCERLGQYKLVGSILEDKITWVNPRNTRDCDRDPDMQLGRVTRTPVSFEGGDFHLHLHLGDDPLVYVWKKVEPIGVTSKGDL